MILFPRELSRYLQVFSEITWILLSIGETRHGKIKSDWKQKNPKWVGRRNTHLFSLNLT